MKKLIFLILIFNIFSVELFALSSSSDDKNEGGLLFFSSFSYDILFNNNSKIFTLNVLEFTLFSSPKGSLHIGYLTQFSPDISIFDMYLGFGVSFYPFEKIFSLNGNVYYGLSIFTLNHFSYIADIKANIDIPIYNIHNLSIGIGLRHRNAIRIIDYFNLNENYYKIYNCYIFEIGYKIIL